MTTKLGRDNVAILNEQLYENTQRRLESLKKLLHSLVESIDQTEQDLLDMRTVRDNVLRHLQDMVNRGFVESSGLVESSMDDDCPCHKASGKTGWCGGSPGGIPRCL